MKQIDLLKRDNLTVDFIKNASQVMSAKEIANYLTVNGYKTNASAVHGIILKLMYERNLPICSLNAKGYLWARTQSDIENTIKHLNSRVFELQYHIKHLESFLIK